MAFIKKLHELSLEEINEEIKAAGIEKTYKRLDAARSAVKKLVAEEKLQYAGEGAFVDEDAMTEAEKAAAEAAKAEKAAKEAEKKAKEKPAVVVVFPESITDEQAEMIGKSVFSRHGKRTVVAVGHVEGNTDEVKYKLDNNKIVAASSCRLTAVRKEYRSRYEVNKDQKTASGKPSIGVQDEITAALVGKSVEDLAAISAENGIDFSRWDGKNPGMKRMNLGNVLRGRAKKGERVVIGGVVIVEGSSGEPQNDGENDNQQPVEQTTDEAAEDASETAMDAEAA